MFAAPPTPRTDFAALSCAGDTILAHFFSTAPCPTAARELLDLASRRILILDGAMGTMIQRYKLEEADYRGARFADWPRDVKGNNDLLVLTRPAVIREIHSQYLAAGADILETCTFNANSISMADYGMEALVHEINLAAAKLARESGRRIRHPGQAPFRGRRAGPHLPHRDPVAGRERSGLPQRQLRPAGGHLLRGHRRPGEGRRRPDPDRNGVRHPERQGRRVRGAEILR
jgi:hypothetical protein